MPPDTPASCFLDLQGISHSYGRTQALVDVTVRLDKGRVGLLGPNGAGKSTLLKILLGLIRPDAGSGAILGHDIRTAGPALRRAVGFMSEADAFVPGMRGVSYVALAGELYGMSRKQALRRAHEVLTYLDLGEARYRKVEEYSTGMKQRLKLAQALVHDPPALLLDEPTSGLDPAGRQMMLDLLLRLGTEHGKALLLSTHLLGDVEKTCEAVIILHQGRALCHGELPKLIQRRQDRYRVTFQNETPSLLEDLRLEGVLVLQDNGRGEYRVRVPPGFSTRAFFIHAAQHQAMVRGLVPDDEDLEELFHRVIEGN
ncbi:MAG: ABC transporter ATP-binding protein [Gemmataceae bacterium]